MAIIRASRPRNAFTQIRNDVLRDDRLSYRARGVLAVILSYPDDWSTSAEALARGGQEGRDAIRTALTELEDAGYLRRERRQDGRGRWATQAVVYDQPQAAEQESLFPQVTPTTDFQPSVFQPSVDQPSVSQAIKTNTVTNTPPSGGAAKADAAPAAVIAKAVYDHAQGMVNFMAVRQIAAKALKITPLPTAEQVTAVMIALNDAGRPITLQTVGQGLSRRTTGISETNDAHWANGGEF